jgi:hypothetical protein
VNEPGADQMLRAIKLYGPAVAPAARQALGMSSVAA